MATTEVPVDKARLERRKIMIEERAAQGLPAHVTDQGALQKVAVMFKYAK